MKLFRPTQLACAALAAAAFFSGCSKKPTADVLARVGDKEITVADFKLEYERRLANRWSLPDRQALLNQMIERETYLQQAKAAGLDSAAEIRRAYEDILIAKYKDTRLAPKIAAVKVSPDEVKAAYEKDLVHFTQPAKVKLAIVFIAASTKANTNQIAIAETRAAEAFAKARLLPADARGFGQVAVDYSDDQITRYRGGDAGWFTADFIEGRWPNEIVAAGFALKNSGDLSSVLHGKEGFYLVKKLDSRDATVTPLEQVRASIEHRLLFAKQQAAEQQFQAQARAAAKVVTDAALLSATFYPNPSPGKNILAQLPVSSEAP